MGEVRIHVKGLGGGGYYLCMRMIIDDGRQPKQLKDWALTYVFGFNLYELLVEVY
jgi:hypothetical protein